MRLPYLYIALLAACQGSPATSARAGSGSAAVKAEAKFAAVPVELRTADGTLLSKIEPGLPCAAIVDSLSITVDENLAAMNGTVKYSATTTNGSIVLLQDDKSLGRISEPSPNELDLFDAEGMASIRASVSGGDAIARDKGGSPVRELRRSGSQIIISSSAGDMTVTGTSDLLLAAVLTATEASPEVRALAACHRMQKAAS